MRQAGLNALVLEGSIAERPYERDSDEVDARGAQM
jgi:hypothetical protein